ncbi:uncharacterized protein DUF202 [Arcticibacter tournemirensis]|uniref:DUF202 domain-containing protein n=1 Tax=Arcticibacter tournemirensis TaxID=699437 RepID=A0A5M9GT82_9SPHI|nr:DUF202 domain-containing protein [Arcticibacter tournemirensis]KAA8477943.1 DUF202 domain-containing protein [Arcticibacter tournemirensis]TQM48434.1 uncharacterized protein DUF202 [Arcticibacter tournemirensis]
MNSEHTDQYIEKESTSVNNHLANERTFLAWIRTSIVLMGFGFVVVKFAPFIRQISFVLGDSSYSTGLPGKAYSSIIGVLLVAIGTLTAACNLSVNHLPMFCTYEYK